MSLRVVLFWLRRIIIVCAVISTIYLYLYPYHFGCAFPSTTGSFRDGFKNTIAQHVGKIHDDDPSIAPFRLLVLADPQLEGDSSLPDPNDALLARISVNLKRLRDANLHEWKDVFTNATTELIVEDIPRSLWALRKKLDLFGNDYYLAHIFRTLHWWTKPTHVTVLGDLVGSQWVSDDEFEWRAWRYWNRVFAGSRPVDDAIMAMHRLEKDDQKRFELDDTTSHDWSRRIINIAGNHDIGYAGDISQRRIERFEHAFGKANWDIKFSYPGSRVAYPHTQLGRETPQIHLIVLNSMLLDTPAFDETLQSNTYGYLNNLISERLDPVEARNSTFTLLLTHVPLHKPEGVCVDAPFFDFWDFEDQDGAFKKGGLREQNHLSDYTSHVGILQAVYGMSGDLGKPVDGKGRKGLILTGHDHEGCDSVHYVERTTVINNTTTDDSDGSGAENNDVDNASQQSTISWQWKSVHHAEWPDKLASGNNDTRTEVVTSLREITLRSMMGEYSGNAGLLSLWYDFESESWKYEMTMCPLGVQHVWWATHVIDIIALLLLITWSPLGSLARTALPPQAIALPSKSTRQDVPKPDAMMNGSNRKVSLDKPRAASNRSPSQRRRKG